MNSEICEECLDLIKELDRLKELLNEAISYLREGKAKFSPHTTNSHVDVFLSRFDPPNVRDHRAGAQGRIQ